MEIFQAKNKGEKLRTAIDSRYDYLVETKTYRGGFMEENDITDAILEVIPLGTSFDEAEDILRQAGFHVSKRPDSGISGNRPGRFDVSASINPYRQVGFGKISLFVFLSPKKPGDFDVVNKISASLITSNP